MKIVLLVLTTLAVMVSECGAQSDSMRTLTAYFNKAGQLTGMEIDGQPASYIPWRGKPVSVTRVAYWWGFDNDGRVRHCFGAFQHGFDNHITQCTYNAGPWTVDLSINENSGTVRSSKLSPAGQSYSVNPAEVAASEVYTYILQSESSPSCWYGYCNGVPCRIC